MNARAAGVRQLLRRLVSWAPVGFVLSLAALAHANSLTATFDVPAPAAPPPGSSPWAILNLNLNPNGTISGQLDLTQDFTTSTFCFNTIGPDAGFEVTGLPAGWSGRDTGSPFGCGTTSFGTFNSYISDGDVPGREEISFTISRDGGFSSVYDLVGLSWFGNPRVDFAVDVFSGTTVGLAGAISPTPQPPSGIFFATGLLCILLCLVVRQLSKESPVYRA